MTEDPRLWKHPNRKGDEGDAYLFLEALIQEIPQVKSDLEEVVDVFVERSRGSILNRGSLGLTHAPSPKRLTVDYHRHARRRQPQLKAHPIQAHQLVASLLPADGILDAIDGLEDETYHQKAVDAMERFNNKWINGHPNGMRVLQLVCALSVYYLVAPDVADTIKSNRPINEFIHGSNERARDKDGENISAAVSEARKYAGKTLGYKNKNARKYLEDAHLAVEVLYKYKGDLETALESRRKEMPSVGPFTKANLSNKISPFYRALGIRLHGREPLEGRDPIHLPDTILKNHSSSAAWSKSTSS